MRLPLKLSNTKIITLTVTQWSPSKDDISNMNNQRNKTYKELCYPVIYCLQLI